MKRLSLFLFLSVCCLGTSFAQTDVKLEAEDAVYENCELTEGDQYSGGKALAMKENNSKITFTYTAAEAGKYTIIVGYDGQWGEKTVNIAVNGGTSTFQTPVQGVGENEIGAFIMNEGENTIEITPNWTWYLIDYIRISNGSEGPQFDIATAPVDANAADCAKTIYSFLYDNFGKKTISGIMTGDMDKANGDVTQHPDVQAVYTASGKYPALVGFDFMNATGKDAESNSWNKDYTDKSVVLAKDLYKRGGLPAFTWHWRDPSRTGNSFYVEEKDDNGKVKARCDFRITEILNADGTWNTSSDNYQNIIKDIDAIADYFLDLQNEGMACIFRPLHEASGAWFWWGASGAEPFVKLYQLIYDEMVNVKGVHNVIWVWNPQTTNDEAWNPGEDYYDVISIDIYNNANDYSSNYAAFDKLKTISAGKKIIALSENGPIPDIDKEFEEEAVWSWWMPWYQSWNGKFVDKTSNEEWTKCMGDDRVITLEDLAAGWGTTAIQTIKAANTANPEIYDLQGRRLTKAPAKGIYIKDGKKIIK